MATQDDRGASESSDDRDDRSKTTIERSIDGEHVPKREEHAPVNMRELYWKVVHEAQTKIRKANPKMAAKDVLKKARAECFGGIKCMCEIISTYYTKDSLFF